MTASDQPILVAAGDSRAQRHLIPSILARQAGIGVEKSVNIAVAAGDSSSVLAAYREFSHRFASEPIFVVSVSAFCVGDRGEYELDANDEYYRSIGATNRFLSMSAKGAVLSTFAPERQLVRRFRDRLKRGNLGYLWGDRGYRVLEGEPWEDSSNGYPRTISRLARRGWFTEGRPADLPWRQLRQDFRGLLDAGVQVVVLDAPEHPAFLDTLARTSEGARYARFHERLADLCSSMSIPVLRYTADDLGSADPDQLFWDGVHLNRTGAEILSELVGRDLNVLLQRGALSLPVRP